jgi:sensor histidine kinase YesM
MRLTPYSIKTGIVRKKWNERSLKEKISALILIIVSIILMTVLLDVWTIKISLWDFRYSLESNERVGTLMGSMENESLVFSDFIKGNVSENDLIKTMEATDKAVSELQRDYRRIGEERRAWTEKIDRSFAVYRKECENFLQMSPTSQDYIIIEYKLYQMQDYLKKYGSTLVSLTSKAVGDFYRERFPLLFFFPAVILAVAGVLISILARTSNSMNKTLVEPIDKLVEASKKIAANDIFIEDVHVDNKDEMGDLVHAFNKMKDATCKYIKALEENREMLDKLHGEELKKADAENRLVRMKYEVLRNQINPHFLFNTLTVISGMATLEEAVTTDRMIKALSSLLRYILRTEDNEISLEQELSVIKDYMYLQEMRFGDRIKCEIDCEERLYKANVPTFVIQPIIENSIIHGLAKKEEGGYIRIHVFLDEKDIENRRLWVNVSDTGVGIAKDKLEKIRKDMTENGLGRNAIGISNIYNRLKLLYDDITLEIDSIEGDGTITKFSIPYQV